MFSMVLLCNHALTILPFLNEYPYVETGMKNAANKEWINVLSFIALCFGRVAKFGLFFTILL